MEVICDNYMPSKKSHLILNRSCCTLSKEGEMKKMKKLNLLLGTLIATAALSHAVDSYSDVVGYSKVVAPSGSLAITPGFVKAAKFSGAATISGQTLAIAGFTAGSLNESSFTDRSNYPTHYVEITSGTYEGYSFDVVSNTSSRLTVKGIPSSLNNSSISVAVRAHTTLDDLASPTLADYADAVNLINPDGSTTTRFYASGSWIAEDFSTPAGHTVVYPGQSVVLSSGGATITTQGVVKSTKTAVPLYAAAVNFVGPMSPSSATKINNLGIASGLAAYADGINAFSVDGNLSTVASYFSDGTGILDSGFSPLDPNAPDAVSVNTGFTVSVSSDTYWIMPSPLK
jgi:hypothetical protein